MAFKYLYKNFGQESAGKTLQVNYRDTDLPAPVEVQGSGVAEDGRVVLDESGAVTLNVEEGINYSFIVLSGSPETLVNNQGVPYVPSGEMADHIVARDPHPQYLLRSAYVKPTDDILTDLSVADKNDISSADSIEIAIGKLQAQLTEIVEQFENDVRSTKLVGTTGSTISDSTPLIQGFQILINSITQVRDGILSAVFTDPTFEDVLIEDGDTLKTCLGKLQGQVSGIRDSLINKAGVLVTPKNITNTTYTLIEADGVNHVIRMNTSALSTITIPQNSAVPFEVGVTISVRQVGEGKVTFSYPGVTLNYKSLRSPRTAGAGSVVMIHKVNVNEWDLVGDLDYA